MFLSLLVVCAVLSLPSFSLPSSHTHSLRHSTSDPPRIVAYYADWASPKFIDYSLFDIIIFAFALPDQNFQLCWDNDQAPALLGKVVQAAHSVAAKVVLSVGGWTGSGHFSNAVGTPQNRKIFADNILDVCRRYDLDGIDIDWEYPGRVGQQGNGESPNDSANMLQFFRVLKQTLPQGSTISAAVSDSTFTGPDGQPMTDVAPFAQVIDWITLMNYDTYGIRQPPGPNAPLSDACSNSSEPTQNAVGAYNAWTSAGFPSSKIFLGVPAYGYIVESNARRLSTRSSSRAYSEDGSGQIQFQSLVNQGILTQYSDGSFRGAAGFIREWDECSATPYLHSDSAAQVISYDDTESLGMKAAWVKRMNMGGVNLFDLHGDTPQHHLTHALRANLLPNPTPSMAVPSAMTSPSGAVAQSPNILSSSGTSSAMTLTSNTISSSGISSVLALSPNRISSSGTSQSSSVPLFTTLPGGILLFPQ